MRLKIVRSNVRRLLTCAVVVLVCCDAPGLSAASVWRVTAPNGNILYLGGSVHGLASTDYPLPAAYNRAFDASSRLVLENNPDISRSTRERFLKSGYYAKGDSLKNHVDPRTYDYLRRVFEQWNVPENQLQRYRPWMLISILWSGSTNQLGVEGFLTRRAKANGKPISGLESFQEHAGIISGLDDHLAELVLLETFIPVAAGTDEHNHLLQAWRSGDVDTIARFDAEMMRDIPSMRERLLGARNRNWIPKIEGYMTSGQTYFVVAGAGHMGGPDGVLALLRGRGYQIQQL